MKIGSFEVGAEPFLIAEASLNHLGNITRALRMVDAAKDAGCTAVKFQTYCTQEFCRFDDPMYQTFKDCELPDRAWPVLSDYCKRLEIIFLSTPQNPSDLAKLLPLGMPAIKVGSDDFCNLPLLREYGKHNLPLLLSMGMSDTIDLNCVFHAMTYFECVFMVCTSQYPTPASEVNILRLRSAYARPWGFSDHTHCASDTASIMAVALGACVLERHFTLDHSLLGPEHSWACEPHDLRRWVRSIREAWLMRGTGSFELSDREREQKRKYQRRPGEMIRGDA